jgi:choline dehydrogenase-like flavoprotein
MTRSTDVVVVGAGLAGGWAAKQLTEAGLRVHLLDAGPPRTLAELPGANDPLDLSPAARAEAAARQPVQSQHGCFSRQGRHLFVDDVENPYTTPDGRPFAWIRSRQVGGRSLLWGAVTPRFSDHELKAASRDGFGEDWPIAYADLLPFYDEVEAFLGVCGDLPMTPAEQRFAAVVQRRWPGRTVRMARGIPWYEPRPGGGSSWPRRTSQGSTLAAAAATGRLEVTTGAVVARIDTDAHGRAAAVEYVDARTSCAGSARGRLVFLCASTIESARILLLSASPRHPAGLANASGLVGCHLMDHPSLGFAGRVPALDGEEVREPFGGPHGISIPCLPNDGARGGRFLRGWGAYGGAQRRHPAFPDERARFLLHASGEMLPRRENRVTLDAARTDGYGLPVAHIDCGYSDNERALLANAREMLREMLVAAGWEIEAEDAISTPGEWVHEVGTARMGRDPRSSVLNPFNQAWDVPNLFVTDGAAFVTSGWQNPGLTIMALTARACAHALGELKAGRL